MYLNRLGAQNWVCSLREGASGKLHPHAGNCPHQRACCTYSPSSCAYKVCSAAAGPRLQPCYHEDCTVHMLCLMTAT